MGMQSTVDARGRILIPKEVRESMGLKEGSKVEISAEEGAIKVMPREGKNKERYEDARSLYGVGRHVKKRGEPEERPSPEEIKALWA